MQTNQTVTTKSLASDEHKCSTDAFYTQTHSSVNCSLSVIKCCEETTIDFRWKFSQCRCDVLSL